MSQARGAVILSLSCLLFMVNAQEHELVFPSIHVNFFDQGSSALIGDVDIMVLHPIGEELQVIPTDSSGWIQIKFNDQQTIKILATALGYTSDTFTLDLNSPRHTLPLTSSTSTGKILDRQPIQRADQSSQRRAPADQDPMELIVMSEKRGGGMSRLQRVPTKFTGYTIFLRNDRNSLRKGDPITQYFDKIIWQQRADKSYDFYTGMFSNFSDAKNFLVEKVTDDIPDAKIIEFISGNGKHADQ